MSIFSSPGRQIAVDGYRRPYHVGPMQPLFSQILEFSFDPLFLAAAVLLADGLIGDPRWLYRRIPHPVVIIGKGITLFESRLNHSNFSNFARFIFGSLTAIAVIAAAIFIGAILTMLFEKLTYGALLLLLLASSLIAFRGLYDSVVRVQRGLAQTLEQGQEAVSQIVGRNPKSLDTAGVSRAAIESLAENFSDGTIAPIFWFVLFGLPGLLFYKAVNTLDSMIGHHTDRYEFFGKFSARLDDAVNFIPARLTGLLIVSAAFLLPGMDGTNACRKLWRDARHHKSVNAGWQEAAVAGALGISLAGPRRYGSQLVDDVWMNEGGRKETTAEDIGAALRLYLTSGLLLFILLVALAVSVII